MTNHPPELPPTEAIEPTGPSQPATRRDARRAAEPLGGAAPDAAGHAAEAQGPVTASEPASVMHAQAPERAQTPERPQTPEWAQTTEPAPSPTPVQAPNPPTLAGALATPVPAPEPAAETPGRLDITGEWQRVSPKAIVIELLGDAIGVVVVAAAALVLSILTQHPWPWFVCGAIVLLTLLSAAFAPRRIRSIGYLLREDDLLFRRGIMWQRFVAVPYGRMQLVDINRGPLARAFGLAELKFVTASPATGVTIPGLPLEEAERLRDHLVSVAESRRTGL